MRGSAAVASRLRANYGAWPARAEGGIQRRSRRHRGGSDPMRHRPAAGRPRGTRRGRRRCSGCSWAEGSGARRGTTCRPVGLFSEAMPSGPAPDQRDGWSTRHRPLSAITPRLSTRWRPFDFRVAPIGRQTPPGLTRDKRDRISPRAWHR